MTDTLWEILHFLVIHKLVTYSASLRKGASSISRDFLSKVSSARRRRFLRRRSGVVFEIVVAWTTTKREKMMNGMTDDFPTNTCFEICSSLTHSLQQSSFTQHHATHFTPNSFKNM